MYERISQIIRYDMLPGEASDTVGTRPVEKR